MKNNFYEITSPDYPSKKDFKSHAVWCEWHEPEENSYILSLCSSEEEFQTKFIQPYEQGKESYYPIIENPLPSRTFLSIFAEITINNQSTFEGYLSTDCYQVVALHIWPQSKLKKEITLLSNTRLFAKTNNAKEIKKIKRSLLIHSVTNISYQTGLKFSNKKEICGNFEI